LSDPETHLRGVSRPRSTDDGVSRPRSTDDAASRPPSTDDDLIAAALAEDVGAGDATTAATVAPGTRGRATIVQKAPGVVSGLEVAAGVFRHLDPSAEIELGPEGAWREAGAVVLAVEGDARALLTGERTALNFLGRLSGIATLTARVVSAVRGAGSTAQILDTRKTTPGLRRLEKRAVAHGGGVNHRAGLYDAILIKENHAALAGGVGEAVRRAREARPDLPLAVEVRDDAEIDAALAAGAPRLLLDNMTPVEVCEAVARVGGRAEIEVSGGVTPETILVYATIDGVDYVSMGALTHSAPVLDLSLSLESLPT
jgi:nicotinate-nucleotide pyrophosphorylase (carboxylating)